MNGKTDQVDKGSDKSSVRTKVDPENQNLNETSSPTSKAIQVVEAIVDDKNDKETKPSDATKSCSASLVDNRRTLMKVDSVREFVALKTQLGSGLGKKSFRISNKKSMTTEKEEQDTAPVDIEEDSPKVYQKRLAVFNANSREGSSIVRSLAKDENNFVTAFVRVITSRFIRPLLNMKNVRVLIADTMNDIDAICEAMEGHTRAFFVTKYFEKFDGMEEIQIQTIFNACAKQKIYDVVFSTFEDCRALSNRKEKSQILMDANGEINPKFEGQKKLLQYGKKKDIIVTHMITSYLDQEKSQKSICVMRRGTRGNVVITHIND